MTTRPYRDYFTRMAAALACSMLLSLPAFSQEGTRLERLAAHLALSEAQQASVADLVAAHRDRMAIIRGELEGADIPAIRREVRAERQALIEEIEALLDPEQRVKFQTTRQSMQERRIRREIRWRRTMDHLDLSADQALAIETLVESMTAEKQALRQDFREQLVAILDEDQKAKWRALQRWDAGRPD